MRKKDFGEYRLTVCGRKKQDGVFIEKILESFDAPIVFAGYMRTPDQGKQLIETSDILLLEITSGNNQSEYEWVKQILKDNQKIEIVLYFLDDSMTLMLPAFYQLGIYSHIQKPFAVSALQKLLEGILHHIHSSTFDVETSKEKAEIENLADEIYSSRKLDAETMAENIYDRIFEYSEGKKKQIAFMLQTYRKSLVAALTSLASEQENNVLSILDERYERELRNIKDEKEMLSLIREYLTETNALFRQSKKSLNEERIQDAKELIYRYVEAGEPVSLEIIAKEMFISPYYLSRSFKKHEGINFVDYLKKVRLEYGKLLIATTNDYIEEIAFKCGYNEANSFRRLFKASEGISPAEYRKRLRAQQNME